MTSTYEVLEKQHYSIYWEHLTENQNDKGKPLALGYDKWTNNFYANRDLIMNSIH